MAMTATGQSADRQPKPAAKRAAKPKLNIGRPSTYDPKHIPRVIELGAQGCSLAQIASDFGVVRATLHEWAGRHPEFLEAITRARDLSMTWWETEGKRGMWAGKTGKVLNAQLWSRSMSARFPDDYREQPSVTVNLTLSERLQKARERADKG